MKVKREKKEYSLPGQTRETPPEVRLWGKLLAARDSTAGQEQGQQRRGLAMQQCVVDRAVQTSGALIRQT